MFAAWTEAKVWFVTQAKDNMDYRVVKRRAILDRGPVLRDEDVVLKGFYAKQKCPHRLRRIVVWDEENRREIVLLTNHMDFAASTIARFYMDRWQIEIELFVKAIKQNLKIKTFVGTGIGFILAAVILFYYFFFGPPFPSKHCRLFRQQRMPAGM